MIQRHRPPPLFIALLSCLGLAGGVYSARAESAAGSHALPLVHDAVEKAAVAHPAAEHPSEPGAEDTEKKNAAPKATEAAKPADENPVEIQSLLKLGAAMTERGEYESADIAFRQVLTSPDARIADQETALLGLARMNRRQGSLTKAAAIYEKFLKEFPSSDRSPDALLDLGRTHRAMGAYKLAIARFYSVINSTLKLPPEGFERYQLLAKTAQFEIAETHFQAGQFAEAGKFFARLRLLDLAPADRANAHFKAGYSYQLQGNLDVAVTTLRAYLEQWPDDENVPQARYLLAVTLRKLSRQQEALTVTLDLLREESTKVAADPKRWLYWQRRTGNQLANDFFESGETLGALSIYQGMTTLSKDAAWQLPISYQVGLCQERLGNTEQARATFRHIVEAAGATPASEVSEVVRMATWRISHLDWRDKIGQQVTSFFETTTGRVAPSPALSSTETP